MGEAEPNFSQLKKLWTLKTVVDSGGMKTAALRNKISVSAISQSVTGLEKMLNRKLFLKKGNQLHPTPYCLELLNSVSPAFEIFSGLKNTGIQLSCVPAMAWLDLGTSHCVASELLPRLIKQLKTKLPNLKLKLKVGNCQSLVTAVKKGDLCMALVADIYSPKGLSTYEIYEDRLGVFASSAYQSSAIKQLDVASIQAGSEGHPNYHSRFLRFWGDRLKSSVTCDTYDSLYEIALSGAIPAILPQRMALSRSNALKEIKFDSFEKNPVKDIGKFSVRLISQSTCDPAEDQFLISELRSLI